MIAAAAAVTWAVTGYGDAAPTDKNRGSFDGEPDAQRVVIYNNSLTLH